MPSSRDGAQPETTERPFSAELRFLEQHQMAVQWLGWAIQLPREPWLFVEYGCDEASAWRHALGWPDADDIEHAKAQGARAFPVSILERVA